MYVYNNKVHIEKGFMDYYSFKYALKQARKITGDNVPYILHFRISTQGGERKDCTHPYMLSSNMNDLRKLKCDCEIGIAHNGIISLTTSYTKKLDYNDTMQFITDYLSLIIDSKDYYKDKNKITLIERLASGNRFAILDNTGHCELIGNGWINDNGIWYSNTSYKPYIYKKTSFYIPPKTTADIEDKYEDYKDEYTGLYAFDCNCPLETDGDDSYCDKCIYSWSCYSLPQEEDEFI